LVVPADAAVVVFFVLSGYVLAASLRGRSRDLGTAAGFAVRRVFRLYPANIIATAIAALVISAPLAMTLSNMALTGWDVNGVAWSLHIEVIGSALVLLLWMSGGNAFGALLLAACGAIVYLYVSPSIYALYLPTFALGYALAGLPLVRHPRTAILGGVTLVFLSSLLVGQGAPGRWMEAIGATLLVCGLIALPSKVLMARPVQFLGAVSYSFYLLHGIALIVAVGIVPRLDDGLLRVIALAAATAPASLFAAYASYRLIELPGIAAGAAVARRTTKLGPKPIAPLLQ
jgi:peptidoglycan/LPS O-acetylase OafA/YrhL